MKTYTCNTTVRAERARMTQQEEVMSEYAAILAERIAAFPAL